MSPNRAMHDGAPLLMRLSQVFASYVSSRSRTRGESYFRSGAVQQLTSHGGTIEATVIGSEAYTVLLQPGDELLSGSCTCPYFVDHLEICKHIWATILAAEAKGIPLMPPGCVPTEIGLEPLDPDDAYDDGDPDRPEFGDDDEGLPEIREPMRRLSAVERRRVSKRMRQYWAERRRIGRGGTPVHVPPHDMRAPFSRQAQPRKTPARPARPPSWQRLLTSITNPATSTPQSQFAPGQLLYVIDVAATLHGSALVLELMTRDRRQNGEWGKPRPARIHRSDVRAHADPKERHILECLLGAQTYPSYGYSDYGQELTRLEIHGGLVIDFLPLACATGQCVLRMSAPAAPASQTTLSAPLRWDDGPAWTFALAITASGSADDYIVGGRLMRGDECMDVTYPIIVLADGVLMTPSHAARLEVGGGFTWLASLRRNGPVAVPRHGREALIEAMLAAPPGRADVPDDLRIEIVDGQPRPHVRLRPLGERRDRVRVDLAFDYEGIIVPVDTAHPIVRNASSARAIRRAIDVEQHARETLQQRGCRLEWSQETGGRIPQLASQHVPRLVRQLLDDGWHVEAGGRAYRRPGATALSVRSGIDWFELHGGVEFDGHTASLPALLAALERGETFVTLDDGTVGLLPEEWLRRHMLVARFGSTNGDHVRFRTSQAALLDALVAAQPDISWDETFARVREQLKAFDGIEPADPPATFTGTLRGYQREGLGWLLFLRRFGFGGCLADDMGLGKTVMVLALICARRAQQGDGDRAPFLVVAPRSLVFNWGQEAARFAPDLRVLEYVGGERAAMRDALTRHDLVLTTYGTLRRDVTTLSSVLFDYVVLDEAQAIKNASSVSAKTARALRADHRLALSGTPIENHLGELWSLFEFLNPGLLSSAAAFNRSGGRQQSVNDETLTTLARGLRPFMLRRTKEQVASDLPPKTAQTLYCELERPQRALYNELRTHYRETLLGDSAVNGFGRAKLQILEALLRLRQAACHPGLIDRTRAGEPSAKLDVVVPRVIEAIDEGHKTLVFSQFTSLLAILRSRLDGAGAAYEYLDGRTRDRQARVERFQRDPDCRLFLISLKAGGLGLNLTAAEYVFLLDPWWNPAVEAQAIDRAHRIGQARHVFAYRLIARDTVEERVLELQQRKRALADAILTADSSLIRHLRREDLELLLS